MKHLAILLLTCVTAYAQSAPQPPAIGNFVYIDQIGNFNTTTVIQTDSEQKRASVTSTGNNNTINVLQENTGNHTVNVQGLTGSNNVLNLIQSGTGNHELAIINLSGPNSNNTINSNQTGAGDKSFSIGLNGTNGASVSVSQTIPVTDNGSMTIQCFSSCGSYSYIKN